MSPLFYALAADAVLFIHAGIILFNVTALVLIPIGAWRGWRFVHGFWWRLTHLVMMCAVAAQAVAGRACFLTYWEADLAADAGEAASTLPLVQRWVADFMYWSIPVWVFAVIYSVALVYSFALWRLVPPRRKHARPG